MKKILLACLALLFILPTPDVFSVGIDGAWIIADHRKDASGVTSKEIQAYIGLTDLTLGYRPALSTGGSAGSIINTNPPTAANTGYLNDSPDFYAGANDFDRLYDAGNPTDLAKFENQNFMFQLYNNSDNFVQDLLPISTSEFEWLDFISLKSTPQGAHPTFEWDDVQNADQYRIRIFTETEPVLLFNETFAAGQGAYSYQYTGDLFNQYDDAFFRLEARAISGGTGNRSMVFGANPVPEPGTLLLLGSGLVGLVGFRRKKFKK